MIGAIDLGGTNIKLGLFSEKGPARPAWQGSLPAYSEQGIFRALEAAKAALQARLPEDETIRGLGIGMPGVVNGRDLRLLSVNAKYADAVGFSFDDWCRERFDCPLAMENDANAALIGENTWGCGHGSRDCVMMILGTGIGTAAIVNGRLLRGAHFQAGILGGHFVVEPGGAECSCGGRGCLEALAGSRELEKRFPGLPGYEESLLGRQGRTDLGALINARQAGDPFACREFDRLMELYAAGIINLIHAYDPELVILSGGVMQSAEAILPELTSRVWAYSWTPWGKVRFEVAARPNESVLMGLYTLAREKVDEENR